MVWFKMKRALVLIILVLVVISGCIPKEEAKQLLQEAREEAEISQRIELTNFEFTPKHISVEKGDIIEFVNTEGTHTVTIDELNIDQVLNEGDSFTAKIDQEGTFELTCRFHLSMGMNGIISTEEIEDQAVIEKQKEEKVEEAKEVLEKEAVKVTGVQEFEIVQTLYPGKFDPPLIVAKKGVPVRIYMTTTKREHVNRVSILPFVSSSDLVLPRQVTIIEFTPNQIGEFKIRNIGHGFEGTLRVVE